MLESIISKSVLIGNFFVKDEFLYKVDGYLNNGKYEQNETF